MMKKFTLALFIALMSLLIITPKLWAQGLICVEANGLLWCYNDQACGQPCNEVCETIGSQPIADNTVWSEAQDTVEECRTISQAFDLGDTVDFQGFQFGCLEDQGVPHPEGSGLIPPLLCTAFAGCPASHRTGMDDQDIPCSAEVQSRRSICPCVPPPPQFITINLSPNTATNDTGTEHTVTATVELDGSPAPGALVTFEITSGPNAGEISDPNNGECSLNDDCTTDSNGQVSWTYSSVIPGTDAIVASVKDNIGTDIESNPVEKIWEPFPIPTLSEWAIIVMAGVLGIIGLLAIRRRKLTA